MTVHTDQEDRLLYTGADWDFPLIKRLHDACEDIALKEMGLDIYPVQIEVITSEQMLDAYSSTGMPLFYQHWSFGKRFARNEALYRRGLQGLAYEIVINSDPCLCYIMEENTATMQATVIAHAAMGHNHFFKNNHVFRQWTDADGILDYLAFAKTYIARCEDRYGHAEVERILDAAHALMANGVHRSPRKRMPDLRSEELRERERRAHGERLFNDLWRTVPGEKQNLARRSPEERRRALLGLPEENLLYFLEKTAPRLLPWQREILRIVRLIAQYFYPQRQTKLMNEGCATFCHYHIMSRLHEQGRIDESAFIEFLHTHTNVILQPEFSDPRYSGLNPYALGFAMMQDIFRACRAPTEEDHRWLAGIAGSSDPFAALREIWANYRDESFLSQFLSPNVIRQFRLFHVLDDSDEDTMLVDAIHDERGYQKLRRSLSRLHDLSRQDPEIAIVNVDLAGDRTLELTHRAQDGVVLAEKEARQVLRHLADLWGYGVRLTETDADSDEPLETYVVDAQRPFGG
jgi:stage V sporulation protein R